MGEARCLGTHGGQRHNEEQNSGNRARRGHHGLREKENGGCIIISRVSEPRPPLTAELIWSDRLRFGATSGPSAIVIDGDGAAGPSPMQLAAWAVAGCMATDVVSILQKGR